MHGEAERKVFVLMGLMTMETSLFLLKCVYLLNLCSAFSDTVSKVIYSLKQLQCNIHRTNRKERQQWEAQTVKCNHHQ